MSARIFRVPKRSGSLLRERGINPPAVTLTLRKLAGSIMGNASTLLSGDTASLSAERRVDNTEPVQDLTHSARSENSPPSELLFRQEVLDSLFAGVVIYGVDGTVLEANRAPIESIGLCREEIIGKPAWDVYWWSHSAHSQSQVREALERATAGETVRDDFVVRTGEDRFSTIDTMFRPHCDTAGRVECIISSGVDVSARKQAEEALRASEASLRAILDSSPECVKTIDWQGRVLDMNAAGLAMVEADSLKDVQGKSVLDLIDPYYQAMYRQGIATVFSGTPTQQEYEVIGLKGMRRWVDQSAVPLFERDDPRRVYAMLAVTRDVTERVKAEQALEEKTEILSSILRIAPEATVIADQSLRILVFSEGASKIFGYVPQEVIGASIELLIPEAYRAMHARHVAAFAAGNDMSRSMSGRAELRGLRKNGEEFPAEASLSKLMTAHGLIYAIVLRDVSHQNAAREELIAAKRVAEQANEAKSRFIANMSHELRTPLNAIIGFSELMVGESFGRLGDPRYREYAADIRQSGQHLLSLINDILDISRIEAGRVELREEAPLEVAELIDHCMRWVRARAANAGIDLRTQIAAETPAVRGDPRRLIQILLNLISNALKFTPAGGLVTVRAGAAADGGVEITIADTGVGMSAEQIARIGEPFLQFDDSKGRRAEGTGLGVSIAKRLAELHGGALTIDSVAGEGTTATVALPKSRSIARLPPRELAARAG
jgi:PAS domain S-box-containing protein